MPTPNDILRQHSPHIHRLHVAMLSVELAHACVGTWVKIPAAQYRQLLDREQELFDALGDAQAHQPHADE
jgi:hypothetical protein